MEETAIFTEEGAVMIYSIFIATMLCYPTFSFLSGLIFDKKDRGDYPGWYILVCVTIYVLVIASINWMFLV